MNNIFSTNPHLKSGIFRASGGHALCEFNQSPIAGGRRAKEPSNPPLQPPFGTHTSRASRFSKSKVLKN